MLVVPYDKVSHKHLARILLKERLMDTELVNDLPKFGLIAIDQGEPVAMGFVREVEGNHALLDSYITNPGAPPELRNKALDIITGKLIKIAEENKVRKLIAFSAESTIISRSIKHGMHLMPFSITIKSF